MNPTRVTPSLDPNPLIPSARPLVLRVFGHPRFHTDGDLIALAFGADRSLWSLEEPGVLRKWDPSIGAFSEQRTLGELETLWAFSPDALMVAAASSDLGWWDVQTGKAPARLAQPSWVDALAVRADLNLIATGHDDGRIRVWDLVQRRLKWELEGHGPGVSALAFSPDGKRLASAAEDRAIGVWDLSSGKQQVWLTGHTDRIPALAWHPEGKILVSAGWDTTARVWDTESGQPIILLNSHAEQVYALALGPRGDLLACADSANAIHVWDTSSWKTLHILTEHSEEIRSLAFSPDGQWLASGGMDRMIHVWDPYRGKSILPPMRSNRHSISVAEHAGVVRLASNCGGIGVRVWDGNTGQVTWQADPAPPTLAARAEQEAPGSTNGFLAVASSPDGRSVATGGSDHCVRIWDAANGKIVRVLEGQAGPIGALAFDPGTGGKVLASTSVTDGTVWLWDLTRGEPTHLLTEAADGCTVEALVFHPRQPWLACGGIDWLATGGSDGAVGLWDWQQNQRIAVFDGGTACLAFHPLGQFLAVASLSESVYVWDVQAQCLWAELGGHRNGVNCVAYSPSGEWLASGGEDRTLRLWDTRTGEPIAVWELDTTIKAVSFSPDSRFLFTGNGNTTCYQLRVAALLEGQD